MNNFPQLILKNQKNNIPKHCISKIDICGNFIATLDGWNKGFNNVVLWNFAELKEL